VRAEKEARWRFGNPLSKSIGSGGRLGAIAEEENSDDEEESSDDSTEKRASPRHAVAANFLARKVASSGARGNTIELKMAPEARKVEVVAVNEKRAKPLGSG